MSDMRSKKTGTYDHSTATWRLRGEGIQVSIRQLSKRYGVEIPKSERASAQYWRRYLQDVADSHQIALKSLSPLPDRIASIEYMITRLQAENRSEGDLMRFKGMLTEAINVPAHSIDYADIPVLHPDVEYAAKILGLDSDELGIGLLNSLIPLPPTKPKVKDGIKHEAEMYIKRHLAKGHHGHYQVRQAVGLFTEQTGDISVQEVNVHHWRKYHSAVTKHATWGKRTQVNQVRTVITFLKRIESDHNVSYGFIRNPDYRILCPEGQKVQYTIDQVKLALKYATGSVRFALLIGLNTGAYWGDIRTLKPEMIQDNRLVRSRQKLAYKQSQITGSWLLWKCTLESLVFDSTKRKLESAYSVFAKQHNLPPHKALRKTTAQLIQDHVGESEARLFRGEGGGDTHNKNYIKPFTELAVQKLDNALQVVAKLYGLDL